MTAARMGSAQAWFNLGLMHQFGSGQQQVSACWDPAAFMKLSERPACGTHES